MRVLFSIALIPVLALAARGQTGSTIPRSFFGISALGGTYPASGMGALGHPEFSWADLEPARGNFNFALLDGYVAAAQQHGLVSAATTASLGAAYVAFTLSLGTPSWAVTDQTKCPAKGNNCTAPPDNIQDWTNFITALLQRYNGVQQPHIQYYELWQEANNSAYWTGSNAQMMALAQAAYPIIHADRNSQLLTPSVMGAGATKWMTAYLQAGGARYADAGSFHGYLADPFNAQIFPMPEQDTTAGCAAACYGSIVTQATELRQVFDNYGLSGKPMLMTEGSWGFAQLDSTTQAAWVARYMLLLAGLRTSLNLEMAGWYAWSLTSGWGNLAGGDGQPTQAGTAFSQLYNWTAGAAVLKPCAAGSSNGTWVCSFTRPGGYVAEAVWNSQGTAAYTPGLSYQQYRDLTGNTTILAPDASIQIGALPVWIEGIGEGTALTPAISLVANAEGETPAIAPNSWVEIKGINLARAGDSRIWTGNDFLADQMPTQMDGVSVSVNGEAAYLYYISPTQVNVLTPPDPISGSVPIQLTTSNGRTPAFLAPAQAIAPSFFVLGSGPYLAAQHANGNLLGPVWLYPGVSTPASPGETIVLYGNGFGATNRPVQSGLPVQSGILPANPTIQIGGVNAAVLYAGLTGPGQFQFNVVVPASLTAGDWAVTATYQGLATQAGVFIAVQP